MKRAELKNQEIRKYAKAKGVTLWQIAERMNISDPTITRKLRHELSEPEKAAIKKIIDKIAKETKKKGA